MTLARKVPVASFSPALLRLLIRGGLEEVSIDFSAKNPRFPQGLPAAEATKLAAKTQMQLYHLRARMREENHPDTDTAYRAEVVRPKGEQWKIIVRPRDSAIEAFLDEAAAPSPMGIAPDDIEEILKDIPESGER